VEATSPIGTTSEGPGARELLRARPWREPAPSDRRPRSVASCRSPWTGCARRADSLPSVSRCLSVRADKNDERPCDGGARDPGGVTGWTAERSLE